MKREYAKNVSKSSIVIFALQTSSCSTIAIKNTAVCISACLVLLKVIAYNAKKSFLKIISSKSAMAIIARNV